MTAELASTPPAQPHDLVRAWRLATYAVLLALAVAAWLVTDVRMSGMDMGPGSDLGSFAFFLVTWVVMMAAMMFPSTAPMVALFVGLQRGRRRKQMPVLAGATPLFVAGYLVAWTAFGLLAYAAVRASADVVSWDEGGRWLAVGVLLAAAAYEATPMKLACLRRCRGPLSFLLSSWRDGRLGALRMGVEHGAWCVGCCWGLMAALFALGVMSLAWMALIGALIAVEKLLPWRRAGVAVVAGLLVALALGLAVDPSQVPGLTVPGDSMPMG